MVQQRQKFIFLKRKYLLFAKFYFLTKKYTALKQIKTIGSE